MVCAPKDAEEGLVRRHIGGGRTGGGFAGDLPGRKQILQSVPAIVRNSKEYLKILIDDILKKEYNK